MAFPSELFYITMQGKGLNADVEGTCHRGQDEILVYPPRKGIFIPDSQAWYFEDGFIVNEKSGKVLHCLDGAEAGHRVIQHDRDARIASTHQNWEFVDGIISPVIAGEQGLAVVVRGTSGEEGAGLYLEIMDRADRTQHWTLSPVPGNRTRSIGDFGDTKAVTGRLFVAKEYPAYRGSVGSQAS